MKTTDSKINYFFILTFITGIIIGALIFSCCTKIPDSANTDVANVKISLNYAFPAQTGDITAKDLKSTYSEIISKMTESTLGSKVSLLLKSVGKPK